MARPRERVRHRGRGPARGRASPAAGRRSRCSSAAAVSRDRGDGGRAPTCSTASRRSAPGTRVIAVWRMPERGDERRGRGRLPRTASSDPGNVGTIVRTAAALGRSHGSCSAPGSADPYSPKAARATMGAIFAHPPGAATLVEARRRRGWRWSPRRRRPRRGDRGPRRHADPLPRRRARRAARRRARRLRRARRRSRSQEGAESLNVAAAAAIGLQRISSLRRRWGAAEHDARADRRAARRGPDRDRGGAGRRRARGAAGPLPRPQGRADDDPARDRRARAAERGPVGKAGNQARGRARVAARRRARSGSRRPSSTSGSRARRST